MPKPRKRRRRGMRPFPPSVVAPGHRDFTALRPLRREIERRVGGREHLSDLFPVLVLKAFQFVLDPVRTARTRLRDLDNVEKTFIGLKAEHFLRDLLDAPKGVRDLVLLGRDVDVKNTVTGTWMIPQETYTVRGSAVLLIAADETRRRCWLGLLLVRPSYLGKRNNDKKRAVLAKAKANILWLVDNAKWPENPWRGIDMRLFRRLRSARMRLGPHLGCGSR